MHKDQEFKKSNQSYLVSPHNNNNYLYYADGHFPGGLLAGFAAGMMMQFGRRTEPPFKKNILDSS